MILPKITNVTSNNKLQPVLTYAVIEDNYLIGTNAQTLAKIDLREHIDQDIIDKLRPYALSKEIQKQLSLKKWETIDVDENIITLADKKGNKATFELDAKFNQETRQLTYNNGNSIGRYPAWEAVMPKGEGEPLTSIGLNVKLLHELSEAVSPNTFEVKMTFYGTTKAVLCESSDSKHIGVIMPIKL